MPAPQQIKVDYDIVVELTGFNPVPGNGAGKQTIDLGRITVRHLPDGTVAVPLGVHECMAFLKEQEKIPNHWCLAVFIGNQLTANNGQEFLITCVKTTNRGYYTWGVIPLTQWQSLSSINPRAN